MISCTVLILTYKGLKHLEFLLPTVRQAIANALPVYKINVLVVDNGCHEPTRNFVNAQFPEYDYCFSPANDYLFSLNSFVKGINDQFTFILNDDMKLQIGRA